MIKSPEYQSIIKKISDWREFYEKNYERKPFDDKNKEGFYERRYKDLMGQHDMLPRCLQMSTSTLKMANRNTEVYVNSNQKLKRTNEDLNRKVKELEHKIKELERGLGLRPQTRREAAFGIVAQNGANSVGKQIRRMSMNADIKEKVTESIQRGLYADSIASLRGEISRRPEDVEAKMMLGLCCQMDGDEGECLRIYEEVRPQMELREASGEQSEVVSFWQKYRKLVAALLIVGVVPLGFVGCAAYGCPQYYDNRYPESVLSPDVAAPYKVDEDHPPVALPKYGANMFRDDDIEFLL